MFMKVGHIEQLTKEERRALRARARLQRKIANGTPMCGARTRKGTPCQATKLLRGGRCKLHGGMSTGPKTPEGLARQMAALARGRKTVRAKRAARPAADRGNK